MRKPCIRQSVRFNSFERNASSEFFSERNSASRRRREAEYDIEISMTYALIALTRAARREILRDTVDLCATPLVTAR